MLLGDCCCQPHHVNISKHSSIMKWSILEIVSAINVVALIKELTSSFQIVIHCSSMETNHDCTPTEPIRNAVEIVTSQATVLCLNIIASAAARGHSV